MARLSAYILAYNQAHKIKAAIDSVQFADEIVLVDSYSTDATAEIAKNLGARVVQVEFKGFGDLRNQAISHCQYEWILSIDSDERCTPEAQAEIQTIIQASDAKDAYLVPRKNIFMNRWIKHSWPYPNYRQPQLFKKQAMRYTLEPVHEGYEMLPGKTLAKMQQAIWQIPFVSLTEMLEKTNRYSSLGAEKLSKKQLKASKISALLHGFWAFAKHYFFKLGFLDGWPGFIIALSNFEGTFYRYAKLIEMQQEQA